MASSKDRQRKLARAKFDRQMARRAERERLRRRVLSGAAAGVAVLVVVGGGLWIGGAFDKKAKPSAADQALCAWTKPGTTTNLTEVGTPPTKGFATTGTLPMTITTNQGDPIGVTLDVLDSPCASESMNYLAGKKFFDNTPCYEVTSYGAIHCGDPKGTGQGGPTYAFYDEDLPSPASSASASPAPSKGTTPLYPAGTVAMIGNPPGTNGSQFLIFTKDYNPASPEFPIIGKVTSGLDTVTKISKIPLVEGASGDDTKPQTPVTITTLTVGSSSATSSANPSAAPSASSQS